MWSVASVVLRSFVSVALHVSSRQGLYFSSVASVWYDRSISAGWMTAAGSSIDQKYF